MCMEIHVFINETDFSHLLSITKVFTCYVYFIFFCIFKFLLRASISIVYL